MASSSSSHQKISEFGPFSEFERKKFPVPRKLYDAFINHRGPDVKETVAAALHKYLKEKDCLAFLDDREFELGDPLIPTIANAIYTSRVQIAIFSPRYAESSWCLDELLLMLKTEARFIPVFCDVKPDDLRYLYKGIYAQAFQKHEENGRYSEERLHQWKEALRTSSGMSGHIFSTANGYEGYFLPFSFSCFFLRLFAFNPFESNFLFFICLLSIMILNNFEFSFAIKLSVMLRCFVQRLPWLCKKRLKIQDIWKLQNIR